MMEVGAHKSLRCTRCVDHTDHTLESGADGVERWWCLCGLATDGTDRQWVSIKTESETV
jgi:hypothetical protein